MAETTSQRLAELKQLNESSQTNIYRQAVLCREILDDQSWIIENFAGDYRAASQHLSKEYLSVIHDLISIGQLVDLATEFPKESQWKDCNYNLKQLLILYRQRKSKQEPTRERIDYRQLVAELREQLAKKDDEIHQLQQKIIELQEQLMAPA